MIENIELPLLFAAGIGLSESAVEFFPEATGQRCIMYWCGNVFSHVPSTKVREIAAMLKVRRAITAQAGAVVPASLSPNQMCKKLRMPPSPGTFIAGRLTCPLWVEAHSCAPVRLRASGRLSARLVEQIAEKPE